MYYKEKNYLFYTDIRKTVDHNESTVLFMQL